MSNLKLSAQHYAKNNWHVMPLHWVINGKCSCTRPHCPSPGKHPLTTNGFKDATIDYKVIDNWWTAAPQANVGIRTGGISNLVVLDIDPKNGGSESLANLVKKYGPLPKTLSVNTGGGGGHYYFKYSDKIPTSSQTIAQGIDIRSNNALVVAPPSSHVRGKYSWSNSNTVLPPPEWLQYIPSKPRIVDTEGFIQGNRNNALLRIAGSLRRKGFAQETIYEMLLAANKTQCRPPLPEHEVLQISKSIMKYENSPLSEDFQLISLKDLIDKNIPEKQWVVDKLLPRNGLSLFVGKPKAGKSTLARQMLLNIAKGKPFLGRQTYKTLCYYLCFEDEDIEVKNHFVKMGATGEEPIKIYTGFSPDNIYQQLSEISEREQPGLILIDTLARLIKINDFNNYSEVTSKLAPFLKFAREGRGHVCFVHHANKSEELEIDSASGSNALTGTVDTVMLLGRKDKGRVFKTRQRSGKEIDPSMLVGNHEEGKIQLVNYTDI